MKIYHYTTLETLALILKHKTIRFNRLDRMDDPCDRIFMMNQLDWSPYTYVSCWTENPEESMSLWHFYNGGTGIRIGIDKDFIDWDKQSISFSVPSKQRFHEPGSKSASGTISVTFNPTRIHRPLSTDLCFHHVKYLNEEECKEFVNKIGRNGEIIDIDEYEFRKYAGLMKKDKWAFQDESRFVICAVPYTSTDAVVSHKEFIRMIRLRMPNHVPFIDVPIKPDKFKDMDITLGPNAGEGHFLIAQSLLQRFAPYATLNFSTLDEQELRYMI